MIVWTTEFPLSFGKTCEDVFGICKKWLFGSPHYTWTEDMLPGALPPGITVLKHAKDLVEIGSFSVTNERWAGFRHCRRDSDSLHWTTEIVAYQNGSNLFVSIQLHCFVDRPNIAFPTPNKPYVVKQILEELGGGLDGGFQVTSIPLYLGEAEVEEAARVIRGDSANQLPVIYTSATWEGRPSLNAEALARKVSGMAHVVVEPSRYFSFALAREVNNTNAYGGAVSICWPEGVARQSRFLPQHYTESEMFSEIIETLRVGLSAKKLDARCSWEVIREMVSRANLSDLQRKGDAAIIEYTKAFDVENDAINEQLKQARQENERLRSELKKETKLAPAQTLLSLGSEPVLYQGEIQDVVIHALKLARNQVFQGGRCQHIIDDLLKHNATSETRGRLEEELKTILAKSDGLGRKEKRALEMLGFELSEDGKHNKLVFAHDDRYTFVTSKTGSDGRGPKNFLSDVTKKLFK